MLTKDRQYHGQRETDKRQTIAWPKRDNIMAKEKLTKDRKYYGQRETDKDKQYHDQEKLAKERQYHGQRETDKRQKIS